jgi:hypothetical protein
MLSSSLAELDPAHPIHPVMSYRGHEAAGVRVIRAGQRATITDGEGRHRLAAALAAFHDGFGVPYDWQHKIPSRYTYRNPSGLPRLPIIRWWARCVASACWPASNS